VNDQISTLRPPPGDFLRALDAHHRWAQPGQYPTDAGQNAGVELRAERLDLTRTDFSAIDLADVWWLECVVDSSRFADVYMPGFRAFDTSWAGCDFARARLAKSEATRCDYSGSTFSGAYLLRLELWECDLREADLSGADLAFFSADKSDLRNVAIRDTILDGVSLHGSHVAGLELAGCTGTITGADNDDYLQINIGTPSHPEWLVGADALRWLRSRGAPSLAFYAPAAAPG
jgi:hypothetical protein